MLNLENYTDSVTGILVSDSNIYFKLKLEEKDGFYSHDILNEKRFSYLERPFTIVEQSYGTGIKFKKDNDDVKEFHKHDESFVEIKANLDINLNKVKRLVILEFTVPIGGRSKTRARQSITALLNRYRDVLGYESEDVMLRTVTMPIKSDTYKGPFLRVVFDSNVYYVSAKIDEILEKVEKFNANFFEEFKKMENE